jgi:hypothetical protein
VSPVFVSIGVGSSGLSPTLPGVVGVVDFEFDGVSSAMFSQLVVAWRSGNERVLFLTIAPSRSHKTTVRTGVQTTVRCIYCLSTYYRTSSLRTARKLDGFFAAIVAALPQTGPALQLNGDSHAACAKPQALDIAPSARMTQTTSRRRGLTCPNRIQRDSTPLRGKQQVIVPQSRTS